MMFRNVDDAAAYVTGVQDQLSAAAQRGDKQAMEAVLTQVYDECPVLGEVLMERVVNDSLRKLTN